MNQPKKFFIHCGLHKTGTTALQGFLRQNTEKLRAAGVLYPYAGCPDSCPYGHHNIAWQLSRDRRYDKGYGGMDALAKEIGDFGGDILLSSEDFECSFGRPSAFLPMAQYAISSKRELVLIVYLRNLISYLESLYCQMLMHGFAEEYKDMAKQVRDKNMVSMHEWVFHFDYPRIARYVRAIPKAQVMFRNFHSLRGGSIIADFASFIPIASGQGDEILNLRSNVRETPLRYVSLFFQHRTGHPLNSAQMEAFDHLRHMKTGKALRSAFTRKFRNANISLCRKYKLPFEGLSFDDASKAAAPARMERLFSFETQCSLREIISQGPLPEDESHRAVWAANANALASWWTDQSGE